MTGSRPRVAVVYEKGAASPVEILQSLNQKYEVSFVVFPSPFINPLLPLLRELADTVIEADTRLEPLASDLRARKIAGIVTYSESMVSKSSELARILGLPTNSQDTVLALKDKTVQRRRLSNVGEKPISSLRAENENELKSALHQIGLPAVLKPSTGEGSRNTFRVDNFLDAMAIGEQILKLETCLVVEEFIVGVDALPYGDYVSVESVTSLGKSSHVAVTGKFPLHEPFREVGQFWPSVLNWETHKSVLELVEQALRALDITTGITHTEVKLSKMGPKILEVNGRLGGNINELSSRSGGPDLIMAGADSAVGTPLIVKPYTPQQVYFQHSNLAPTYGCIFEGVKGDAAVRSLPGIESYRQLVRKGEILPSSVETKWLDMVKGHSSTHTEMLETISRAQQLLEFKFSVAGNSESISALHLAE